VDGAVEAAPVPAPDPAPGNGTVLIVEDEPAVRDMTTRLLERAGFDVVGVADGLEAIARSEHAQPIDVLVTDVVMPNLGGIETAEQMMARYPDMGVVLLSGYTADSLDLERVVTRGATFVSKPVTSSTLVQAVVHAVAAAAWQRLVSLR
jgi:two-component system, cell cycle sensor histidine kinase and response regulator CckA